MTSLLICLVYVLRCCKKEGLRRSIAVEVKLIVTDAARQKFLDLLR